VGAGWLPNRDSHRGNPKPEPSIHRGDAKVNELPVTLVCKYISCIVVVIFSTIVVLLSFRSCLVLVSHSLFMD
jgi:hypothetical protein